MTSFPIDELQKATTPLYAYDVSLLRRTLNAIKQCIAQKPHYRVHYALKANNNTELIKIISASGLGADCVSLNEIRHAIANGFHAADIVFAGVGKRAGEIAGALEAGIGCFNVESVPELQAIDNIAAAMGRKAPVAIRINPDIDAHTHPGITTGTYEDQFGIPLTYANTAVELAVKMNNVDLIGLHCHIGSQITDMEPFLKLCQKINELVESWREKGIEFRWINVGGGLGIDYDEPDSHPIADFSDYFNAFTSLRLSPNQQLHFELGRAIVAQCGSLITRVLYVKEGVGRRFAIVDAGFNDLVRPALYGARHRIDDLTPHGTEEENYDVVGPICESTDCFGQDISLPVLHQGDILALRSAGAYGETMASTYNMRALPGTLLFE